MNNIHSSKVYEMNVITLGSHDMSNQRRQKNEAMQINRHNWLRSLAPLLRSCGHPSLSHRGLQQTESAGKGSCNDAQHIRRQKPIAKVRHIRSIKIVQETLPNYS